MTTAPTPDLKPCFRCGSEGVFDDMFVGEDGHGIHCDNCGLWTGEDMDTQDAIEWWNHQPLIETLRATIAAQAATIEQLEEDADVAETKFQQQSMILEQQAAEIEELKNLLDIVGRDNGLLRAQLAAAQQEAMPVPVWSDEEVQEWVSQLRANGTPDSLIYAKVTSRIVADCEAGRRADAATITILGQEIERLRAQLAAAQQQYEPVPDGKYTRPNWDGNGEVTWLITHNATEIECWHSSNEKDVEGIWLADDWCICRRVPAAQPKQGGIDDDGDDWSKTVDYLLAHAPEPEPPEPEPPDGWGEDDFDDEDKPHYDTPGGW